MTLPASGLITLNNIKTEFGVSGSHRLLEFLASQGIVSTGTLNGFNVAIPSSPTLYISNFYGTTNPFYYFYTLAAGQFDSDFVLTTRATAAGWGGITQPLIAIININGTLGSSSYNGYAFDT